ncbi:MAG: hypothetical protein HZA37_01195 [Parcubacteria group bacterium]|nr:hypothetical protein [Parcubacteria group bacterium]
MLDWENNPMLWEFGWLFLSSLWGLLVIGIIALIRRLAARPKGSLGERKYSARSADASPPEIPKD